MLRFWFVFSVLILMIAGPVKASERVCLSLEGPTDLEFDLTASDDFFNCIEVVSYGPFDKLKVSTTSMGMEHSIKVYTENGSLEDRLQVGIDEYDSATFSSFTRGSTKIVELIPTTPNVERVTVRVSHFIEVDGTQVLIISSQLQELKAHTDPEEPEPPLPPRPPSCPAGEICFEPLSADFLLAQDGGERCDATNTPPTQTEMGLKDDEGLNQYLKRMEAVGEQSNFLEAMRYLYIHYSHPAQNPKALPGGTEHGGNFRYGAGAMALMQGADIAEFASEYLTYAGSAFQGAQTDLRELYQQHIRDIPGFDQYAELEINRLAIFAGLAHIENQVDKDSINAGIEYFTEIYQNDTERDSVKDSCSRESNSTQESRPSIGGGGIGGYGYIRPFIFGGFIQTPRYGSICDPGQDCYRGSDDYVEQH